MLACRRGRIYLEMGHARMGLQQSRSLESEIDKKSIVPTDSPRFNFSTVDTEFRVWEFPGLLSEEECRILIESGSGRWQRSRVQKANKGDSGLSDYRTSSTTWIDPSKDLSAAGKVCMKIRGCAKLITGIVDFERLATSELQLVKYDVGQEYKAHYDGRMLPDGTLEARGTFLVYLNDGFEGGETYFPNVGIKVKPERGKAILWYTHLTDQGIEDSRSKHAGLPVKRGEKYLCTQWFSLPA
ncbi:unnamed protein product [Closterium sp. NIES-54]